jgi:hypothetical protein
MEEEIKNPLAASFHKHKKLSDQYRTRFNSIFCMEIHKFYGTNPITIAMGFDVVAFNDAIACPEDISLAEHVQNKFGTEGSEIINALLQ